MNAFCRWLHEEQHIPDALKLQKLKVEQRVLVLLNDAQLRHLLTFKPKTFRQHRTHVAVCLVLDTGLRLSEMLTLRRDDVDFSNLILKVLGKGRKERLVPYCRDSAGEQSCGRDAKPFGFRESGVRIVDPFLG